MGLQTSFYSDNMNNRLILVRLVGWDMRSSCFYQVISETMTGDQWNNDRLDRPGGPIWALTDPYH